MKRSITKQGRPVIGTDEVRGCLAGPVVALRPHEEGILERLPNITAGSTMPVCHHRRTNSVRVARTAQQIDDSNILQASLEI